MQRLMDCPGERGSLLYSIAQCTVSMRGVVCFLVACPLPIRPSDSKGTLYYSTHPRVPVAVHQRFKHFPPQHVRKHTSHAPGAFSVATLLCQSRVVFPPGWLSQIAVCSFHASSFHATSCKMEEKEEEDGMMNDGQHTSSRGHVGEFATSGDSTLCGGCGHRSPPGLYFCGGSL